MINVRDDTARPDFGRAVRSCSSIATTVSRMTQYQSVTLMQNSNSWKLATGKPILFLILLSTLLLASPCHGQKTTWPKNAVFIEVGGNGFIYSLNYSRVFDNFINVRIGVSAGEIRLGGQSFFEVKAHAIALPLTASILYGQGNNRLEFGLGAVRIRSLIDITGARVVNNARFIASGLVGFVHQPKERGVLFRASFTPMLIDNRLVPWFGVSVGYTR